MIIFHLSKLWKRQVLHTVCCYISGEAAGEIAHWSVLGVKGLNTDCGNHGHGARAEKLNDWTCNIHLQVIVPYWILSLRKVSTGLKSGVPKHATDCFLNNLRESGNEVVCWRGKTQDWGSPFYSCVFCGQAFAQNGEAWVDLLQLLKYLFSYVNLYVVMLTSSGSLLFQSQC